MSDNVYEGIGCILISFVIARYWYKWRQNPNRNTQGLAFDFRFFIGVTGSFICGILLIIGYKGHVKSDESQREKNLINNSIEDTSTHTDTSFHKPTLKYSDTLQSIKNK